MTKPSSFAVPYSERSGGKLGSKRLVWERMRALFYGDHLESMRELWEALWYGYERHRPLLITDTS